GSHWRVQFEAHELAPGDLEARRMGLTGEGDRRIFRRQILRVQPEHGCGLAKFDLDAYRSGEGLPAGIDGQFDILFAGNRVIGQVERGRKGVQGRGAREAIHEDATTAHRYRL